LGLAFPPALLKELGVKEGDRLEWAVNQTAGRHSATAITYIRYRLGAISDRFIRNAVGRARQDFVSLTDTEHSSMVRTARLDREGSL
jgi:hypothetical protein